MAVFNWKSFGRLLQDMIDTVTANCETLINFEAGGVLRTIFEAVCGRLDYFTVLLKKILLLCRLATSEGVDVDTFTADYGMTPRLPAVRASGTLTVGRFTSSISPQIIPVGALFLTFDNSVQFQAIADESNPAYVPAGQYYVLPANANTVDITVQAVDAGAFGNVLANTITVVGSNTPGIDFATNAHPFNNGQNQETDQQMRDRFVKYIASLRRGVKEAIEYAIIQVQNNIKYALQENKKLNGEEKLGYFVVAIDDGSGEPSEALLNAVRASIEEYRAFTIQYDVIPPSILETDVSVEIAVEAGFSEETVKAAVEEAIANALNALGFEEFFSCQRIAAIAFSVPGVKDVNNPQLNGSDGDIEPNFNEIIKPGTITVSVA